MQKGLELRGARDSDAGIRDSEGPGTQMQKGPEVSRARDPGVERPATQRGPRLRCRGVRDPDAGARDSDAGPGFRCSRSRTQRGHNSDAEGPIARNCPAFQPGWRKFLIKEEILDFRRKFWEGI